MWVQKYKPRNLKEFVNQKDSLEQFLKWIKNWKSRSKAILLYGPPGSGKTVLVESYANENKLDLIEMNASDVRSAKQIRETLGRSMTQQSLFKRGKIFLIDEVEGLFGKEDFGGVGEVVDIIRESNFPLVLTCNSPWHAKLRQLRNYCLFVQLKKIPVWDVEKRLKEICDRENIKCDKDFLRQLARRAEGDLRSAINDLETLSQGKKEVTVRDLEFLGYRERETNIFDALKMIFKTKTALAAKLSINDVDKDPDEIFWWIENNIANEYEKPEEIAKAFDMLSRADIFKRRISYQQNWKLKAYMIDLMTGGVATAKKEMYRKFTKYQYPSNIMVLGRTKIERKELKDLLKKMSEELHCSTKTVRRDFLPFFKIMLKKKGMRESLMNSLKLTRDELSSLK